MRNQFVSALLITCLFQVPTIASASESGVDFAGQFRPALTRAASALGVNSVTEQQMGDALVLAQTAVASPTDVDSVTVAMLAEEQALLLLNSELLLRTDRTATKLALRVPAAPAPLCSDEKCEDEGLTVAMHTDARAQCSDGKCEEGDDRVLCSDEKCEDEGLTVAMHTDARAQCSDGKCEEGDDRVLCSDEKCEDEGRQVQLALCSDGKCGDDECGDGARKALCSDEKCEDEGRQVQLALCSDDKCEDEHRSLGQITFHG